MTRWILFLGCSSIVWSVAACGGDADGNDEGVAGSSGGNQGGSSGASAGQGGTGGSFGSAGAGGSSGSAGAGGNSGQGGASGGGTGGTGGGTGGTGDCTAIVSCCDDVTGESVDPECDSQNMPVCPSGASWPNGETCMPGLGASCSPTNPCKAGYFCEHPFEQCEEGAPVGMCQPIPDGCDDNYDPVCGCDGMVYGNACEASAAGQSVAGDGRCAAPIDTFECGSRFCNVGSYCRKIFSDVGSEPNIYECEAIPADCDSSPSCGNSCMENELCSDICDEDSDGNLTLTCPGG